jgi:hypothetical protein
MTFHACSTRRRPCSRAFIFTLPEWDELVSPYCAPALPFTRLSVSARGLRMFIPHRDFDGVFLLPWGMALRSAVELFSDRGTALESRRRSFPLASSPWVSKGLIPPTPTS